MITTISNFIQKEWLKKCIDKELIDARVSAPLMLMVSNIEDTDLYEIEKVNEKRTLSQNAYAWKLITEIANVNRLSKEDVYLQMLKDYGQSIVVSIASEIDVSTSFKYYETIGRGKVNGKDFIHYKIFKGSSDFDTKEMGIFLDGIIQEAEQLGIQTLTPDEIGRLS